MSKNWQVSSFNVFCVYNNIQKIIDTGEWFPEIQDVSPKWYENSPEWIVNRCKDIYNDLENKYYSYNELMIYMYYCHLFKKGEILCGNLHSKIIDTTQLFSKNQLEQDKKLIIEINKKLKLKPDPAFELFKIRSEGFSIIYDLTKKKKISPIFFIKYERKVLTNRKEYDIFKHDDYKKFEFILDLISKHLNNL